MFNPLGPVAAASAGNPGTISMSGITFDNPVIFVSSAANFSLSCNSTTFEIYSGGNYYFRVPSGTTSVMLNPSGSANMVLGQDIQSAAVHSATITFS